MWLSYTSDKHGELLFSCLDHHNAFFRCIIIAFYKSLRIWVCCALQILITSLRIWVCCALQILITPLRIWVCCELQILISSLHTNALCARLRILHYYVFSVFFAPPRKGGCLMSEWSDNTDMLSHSTRTWRHWGSLKVSGTLFVRS